MTSEVLFNELPLTAFELSSAETSEFSTVEIENPSWIGLSITSISIEASCDAILSSIISSAEAVPSKDIKQNNIKIIKIELIILVLIKCPPSFNKLIY